MWCGKCQADVAAEVSPDNQRVFCTVCGALLTMIDAPPARPSNERPASDKTKDARDLLQRWSSGKVLDPFGPPIKQVEPTPKLEPAETPVAATPLPSVQEHETKAVLEPVNTIPAAGKLATDESATKVEIASPISASPKSDVTNVAESAPRFATDAAPSELTAKDAALTGGLTPRSNPDFSTPLVTTNAHTDQSGEQRASALRTSPSPFVAAAMNSNPSVATLVSSPAFAEFSRAQPTTNLAPVENPLKVTPPTERPSAPLPPSPFESPTKSETPSVFPPVLSPPLMSQPAPSMAAKIRIDAPHDQTGFQGTAAPLVATSTGTTTTLLNASGPFVSKPLPTQTRTETRRMASWMPTWDPAFWRTEPSTSGNWTSAAGQFLAYAGVLGLTVGACMVVWSYYGGPATYAPTGWLIATAGQMLLFFGVVTLVSGGLEQTTEQVNKRIEQLGDHIIRIEQAAREMNARSIPPAHFAHDRDEAYAAREALAESDNERAVVER